jgi:hypothetical protein
MAPEVTAPVAIIPDVTIVVVPPPPEANPASKCSSGSYNAKLRLSAIYYLSNKW